MSDVSGLVTNRTRKSERRGKRGCFLSGSAYERWSLARDPLWDLSIISFVGA